VKVQRIGRARRQTSNLSVWEVADPPAAEAPARGATRRLAFFNKSYYSASRSWSKFGEKIEAKTNRWSAARGGSSMGQTR